MDWLQVFVLSVVQGITEFLPISSSAHLILVPKFTDWADQGIVFDVALHVGTLLAVMVYFRKDVATIVRGKVDIFRFKLKSNDAMLVWYLGISTVPLLVAAVFLKEFVADGGRSFLVLGCTSVGFGVLLWVADRFAKKKWFSASKMMGFLATVWPRWLLPKLYRKVAEFFMWASRREIAGKGFVESMSVYTALVFGIFQAFALIPGTSRSGACMTAGRLLGMSRESSSRYAMLMAMPVIAILALYSLLNELGTGVQWSGHWGVFLAGIAISCVTALGAIHLLMKFVERIGFLPFVVYRVGLGSLLLVMYS